MKKTLPKNLTNYTNITPIELPTRRLTIQEKKIITAFIKKYNKKSKTAILTLLFIGFLLVFLNVYNQIYDFKLIFPCILFIIIIFVIGKNMLPSISHCKYIQQGQLNGIWSLTTSSSRNRIYYFDVIFTESQTRIKNVKCNKKDYYSAKTNDNILTFSFDGKKAFGCLFD